MTTTIDRLIKIKKEKKIFIKNLQLLARSRIDAAASFRLVNASTISFGDIVSPYTDSRSWTALYAFSINEIDSTDYETANNHLHIVQLIRWLWIYFIRSHSHILSYTLAHTLKNKLWQTLRKKNFFF